MNAETMTLPLNIYQKLNAIRHEVEYAKKDKKVEGQNYMAVTHDMITALVRPHLVAQNVIVVPTLVSSRVVDSGTTTGKGMPIIRYEATYDVAFVNGDTPVDDRVVVRIEAHALDFGDKAPGKAISYAVKYAMLKLLSIETGEDEEARFEAKKKEGVHKPTDGASERLTPEQRIKVQGFAEAMKDNLSRNLPERAVFEYHGKVTDADELVYLWTFFDSKERAAMKKALAAMNEAAKKKQQP